MIDRRFLAGALAMLALLAVAIVLYSHREERMEGGPELPG